jgi:predicted short-subunit dehydrogenase-like oxidoreductase (DUF2520 family)
MTKQLNIIMIGSGNLATQLSNEIYKKGHQIIQIYSRNIRHAEKLASKFNCDSIDDLKHLKNNADLYIIALSDKAIDQVIGQVNFEDKNIVHTAGSIELSVFNAEIKNYGVFYPLQTFTKNKELDFSNIPICIEANNEQFKLFLNKFGQQISKKVWNIDSETRKTLHLTGVLANNFVNHLYHHAEDLLKEKGIKFEILHELIKETVLKAIDLGPAKAQTGPAIRNDIETQKKHLDLLSSKPNLKQIYKLFSEDILLKNK